MWRAGSILLLLLLPALAFAEEFEARVYYVTDGDTFKFETRRLNVRVEDECRMRCYNAPEMTGKESAEGELAHEKLMDLIAFREVKISTNARDRYGRRLCHVWLPDGTYVNGVMREFLEDYPGRDKYLWMEPGECPE